MNLENEMFYNRFLEYKNIIIKLLIEEYGENYEDIITSRINNTYYSFSSSPLDDYTFSSYNKIINNKTKIKYFQYQIQNIFAYNHYKKYLDKYIKFVFNMENNNETREFYDLFSKGLFDTSEIDCYSSSIINKNDIPVEIKKEIEKNQEYVKNIFIKYHQELDIEKIDNIIDYRKKIKYLYSSYMAKNTNYGKKIYKELKKQLNYGLSNDIVKDIIFFHNSQSGTISLTNNSETKHFHYIKIPVTFMANQGLNGYDVCLIHEMIHRIETDTGNAGICFYDNNTRYNLTINELRTQRLAIKIANILHKKNIYILDNPKKSVTFGESCYEFIFPLISDFLDKYEQILNETAINNEPHKLYDYFGDDWNIFASKIDDTYNIIINYVPYLNSSFEITKWIDIKNIIKQMESYYNQRKTKKYVS